MLVGYVVSVPSLPDVDESDSRFAKLRIATSAAKSSVDNRMSTHISSGTSDDLAGLRICATTDVRVVHQQDEVLPARPGSSKRSTTSCGEYWYYSLGLPQLRIPVSAFGLSRQSCICGTAARFCLICSCQDRRRTPQRLLARSERRDLSRDSPRKRDNEVCTSSRQTQGHVLITYADQRKPIRKAGIVPVLEPRTSHQRQRSGNQTASSSVSGCCTRTTAILNIPFVLYYPGGLALLALVAPATTRGLAHRVRFLTLNVLPYRPAHWRPARRRREDCILEVECEADEVAELLDGERGGTGDFGFGGFWGLERVPATVDPLLIILALILRSRGQQ